MFLVSLAFTDVMSNNITVHSRRNRKFKGRIHIIFLSEDFMKEKFHSVSFP